MIEEVKGKGKERAHTGSLSHTFGSVPCECRVPQPPRAYSVQRKVREDSIMIVICSVWDCLLARGC